MLIPIFSRVGFLLSPILHQSFTNAVNSHVGSRLNCSCFVYSRFAPVSAMPHTTRLFIPWSFRGVRLASAAPPAQEGFDWEAFYWTAGVQKTLELAVITAFGFWLRTKSAAQPAVPARTSTKLSWKKLGKYNSFSPLTNRSP